MLKGLHWLHDSDIPRVQSSTQRISRVGNGGEAVLITVCGCPKARLVVISAGDLKRCLPGLAHELNVQQKRQASSQPNGASEVEELREARWLVAAYWDTSCLLKLDCREKDSAKYLRRLETATEPY